MNSEETHCRMGPIMIEPGTCSCVSGGGTCRVDEQGDCCTGFECIDGSCVDESIQAGALPETPSTITQDTLTTEDTPITDSSPEEPPSPSDDDCETPEKSLQVCNPSSNTDSCDLSSSCSYACVPKFCPIFNPHDKITGSRLQDTTYQKLGGICGWFEYVQGSRHDVQVCCDTPTTLQEEHGECTTCDACSFPQKVNSACCWGVEHGGTGTTLDRMERAGDLEEGCPAYAPVCCKCNGNTYTCIGSNENCHETCARKNRFLESADFATNKTPKYIRAGY